MRSSVWSYKKSCGKVYDQLFSIVWGFAKRKKESYMRKNKRYKTF